MARRANDVGRTASLQKGTPKDSTPIETTTISEKLAQEEDTQANADIPVNPSIPEDMDYSTVKRELARFERVLARRVKRHNKEGAAVETLASHFAAQQAELVAL